MDDAPFDDSLCVEKGVGSHKWDVHGVSLDRAGVVEADNSTPRANPDHRSSNNMVWKTRLRKHSFLS